MRLSVKGMVITVLTSVFALALVVPNAASHTSFVSSNPAVGSVVSQWPDQISIEFDEDLISIGEEKANFIVVNNSVGDQVSNNDENIDSNVVTVSLSPNQVEGPVLVFYRVVSADGHPVEGEFTFTYAQDQSAEVIEVEEVGNDEFPISIYIASAAFIASGIFFAIYSYRRRNRS
jgi:methionine-rich copper-binding protein CopC